MNRLKELREAKHMNMAQVAKNLGFAYTTYVSYEKGDREPNSEALVQLASYFHVSVDYLLGRDSLPDNILPLPKTKTVPLLGSIACGEPILADENIEMYVKVDASCPADFSLRCKGDSMINSRIFDGDIVYVRSQPDVDDGEIAAVLIGDEATLKKVYKYPNKLVLRASNPVYDDLVYTDDRLQDIRILGKAVAFFSFVK